MSAAVLLILAKIILGALPLIKWVFARIERAELRRLIEAELREGDLAFIMERSGEAARVRREVVAMTAAERKTVSQAFGDIREEDDL